MKFFILFLVLVACVDDRIIKLYIREFNNEATIAFIGSSENSNKTIKDINSVQFEITANHLTRFEYDEFEGKSSLTIIGAVQGKMLDNSENNFEWSLQNADFIKVNFESVIKTNVLLCDSVTKGCVCLRQENGQSIVQLVLGKIYYENPYIWNGSSKIFMDFCKEDDVSIDIRFFEDLVGSITVKKMIDNLRYHYVD